MWSSWHLSAGSLDANCPSSSVKKKSCSRGLSDPVWDIAQGLITKGFPGNVAGWMGKARGLLDLTPWVT